MEGFEIVMDKKLVRTELLLLADPSLPQVTRQLNQCTAFAGLYHGRCVAVCLLDKKERYHDIVNLAVDPLSRGQGLGREMINYVLDYVRVQGGQYVETGCSNANIPLFALLQRMGFRLVGIWPDYFHHGEQGDAQVEHGILSRDMLRFRLDLQNTDLRVFSASAQ